MGQNEARARRPWIYAKSLDSTKLGNPFTVQEIKLQSELGLKLILPLKCHCWRRGYQHKVNAPPQQQFAEHKPSLYSLSESHIISNQQICPGQAKCFSKR